MQHATTPATETTLTASANAIRQYPLMATNNEAHTRWVMCKNPVCFKPDGDHQWMMDMVAAGLDAGIFYTSSMLEFIERRLVNQLPSDYKSRGPRVEGGVLGMEVYYARRAVEAKREHAVQMAAVSKIRIGDEIKQAEIFANGKTSKWNGTVQEVDSVYGSVKLNVSRRGDKNRYTVTIPAGHNALSKIVKARTDGQSVDLLADCITPITPAFRSPANIPTGQHGLAL
ncbi:hypothetical protein [Pseudomonas baetica]|uniref:hypothetical protein n=1 Tax=Pseudomonas baetica TaxID=674054 RepID=UPI002404CAC8|nr:hypothetical protein [Pseudomonas baetica]MDF9778968.1 phage-related protein [Pseudomonas baetica]